MLVHSRITGFAGIAALALVGSLALTACGSDDNSGSTAAAADTSSAASTTSSAAAVDCGAGGTINAEGSSAQKNAIEQAISSFESVCPDITINYNPTGSGAGVKQFNANQVQFAGSDSALNADKGEVAAAQTRCEGNPAWNIPMVTGPIAIAFNVAGVDKLVLNGEVAAKIFRGDIKTWNDPAIAALNSGVTLPSEDIHVFFRSDESGTTENFTKYLAAAGNGAWTDPSAKAWPSTAAGEGREKSSGVAEGVKSTEGGISYVEWSYAQDNKLGMAQVDTGSGPVELTAESAGKAVSSATRAGTGNDLALKLDYATKAPGAYPIILVTYEIVCSAGGNTPAQSAGIKAFLDHFASADVQKALLPIGYAPLPSDIQADVQTAIAALK